MTTAEVPVCACGVPMSPAKNDHYFICLNCDTVQEPERTVVSIVDGTAVYGRRVQTLQDFNFGKEWEIRKFQIYEEGQ